MTSTQGTLAALKPLIVPLVLFASVTNLAVLVSPLFMMQVLDRVVPSGNLSTLALLGLLAFGALSVNAVVEFLRDQSLSRSASWFESDAASHVLARSGPSRLDGMRNVTAVRDFIRHNAKTAVDLRWTLFFVVAVFLIHPAFMILLVLGSLALFALKGLSGFLTRQDEQSAAGAHAASMDALRARAGRAARRSHVRGSKLGLTLSGGSKVRECVWQQSRTN